MINEPGCPSSNRIITLKLEPIIPDQIPKIKYKVPMSLWFVDISHFIKNEKEWLKVKVVNCKFIYGFLSFF